MMSSFGKTMAKHNRGRTEAQARLERSHHDRIFGTALDEDGDIAVEKEAVALALQFKKVTGKPHPIFGKINLHRQSHKQCVDHIAGLLRRGQSIEVPLKNAWINIGLDPESLRAAAEVKLSKRKKSLRAAWEKSR